MSDGTSGLEALTLAPWEIVLRVFGAMLIGSIIGAEREHTHRPAGMRTHMLVALGAAIVMVTSQLLFCQYRQFGASPDPARLSAQVIAGVGFLCAGTILRDGMFVKGLTTAASVWAVACLGIAMGAGYYLLSVVGAVGMLITLILFERVQQKLLHGRYAHFRFSLESENFAAAMNSVTQLADKHDAAVSGISVERTEGGACRIAFDAEFSGRHAAVRMQTFLRELTETDGMRSVRADQN